MKRHKRRTTSWGLSILLLAACIGLGPAWAQADPGVLLNDALRAMQADDFQTALTDLQQAIQIDPENLEIQYQAGICHLRLDHIQEATRIFRKLLQKNPGRFFNGYIELAAYSNRHFDLEKALEILDEAEALLPRNLRIVLEKAYILKQLGRYEQAVTLFRQVEKLAPDQNQLVSYEIGNIRLEQEKYKDALAFFEQAIDQAPETKLAYHARLALPGVKAALRHQRPWDLNASFSWGFDDNVPQDPLEILTPRTSGVTDKEDFYQVFYANGGYKFVNTASVQGALGYSIYCQGFRNWTQSNVLAHLPYIYVQYHKDPFIWFGQYEFGYYTTGGEEERSGDLWYLDFGKGGQDKLRLHSFSQNLAILEPWHLKTDLFATCQIKDYLDTEPSDAAYISLGLTQSWKIPGLDCFPRLTYTFGRQDADNAGESYAYHQLGGGLQFEPSWHIRVDLSLTYTKTIYDDYPVDGKRRDHSWMPKVTLTRPILDWGQINITYQYTVNRSNVTQEAIDPFNFRKNVCLVLFTVNF